ncbi:MAG: hypothetical protein LBR79_06810, partial [Oscillospiraceae bacterium]|nr:hypothetical protein [Oscillospiraceae bacterium]
TRENLRKFIDKHGFRTPDEFISAAIIYFETTGDDPREPKITAKMAIEKNTERLSQVIAFIREFERRQMKPLLKDVEQTNMEVRQAVEQLSMMNKSIFEQLGVVTENGTIATTIYEELEEIKSFLIK